MPELLNNRYQILQELGSGEFWKTFLAEDTHMPSRKRCVIKELRPATTDTAALQIIKERFEHEAAVLEALGSANDQIPALHAYFIESGKFYLVQDWIEGQSLTKHIQTKGLFSENEVRGFLADLLLVLEYVHSQGIIHCDIKPENILLRERDGKPVLIDFGAVKELVATVVDARGTPTSFIVIGSPGFVPLEQAAGKPVFASDLYSLALTAIYLLTGKRPGEILDVLTGEIAWREHARGVSPGLATLLDKAIRPFANDRYGKVDDMRLALQPSSNPADLMAPAKPRPPEVNRPLPVPDPAAAQPDNASNRSTIPPAATKPFAGKSWALLVAVMYFFALVAVTWPALVIAFVPGQQPGRLAEPSTWAYVYLKWPYWMFIAVLVLFQVALLKVPVGIADRRPVTRRTLLLPVIVTGLMLGLLVVGALFSIIEFIRQKKTVDALGGDFPWILIAGGLIWALWTLIFFHLSRNENPKDVISQQCRIMLKGSILELLIAVPTHIIARSRDYCCAGFMTFLGITLGLAVMLISFGPGVFFLFQERWNRLHKYRSSANDMPVND